MGFMKKKLCIIIGVILTLLLLLFVYALTEMGSTNLDGIPPVELTEGYELYARDVNWNNIIINKQDEHVREKQDQAYEPGIGYAVCENVKYYFVQKEKALIGVNNGEYLLINTENDQIQMRTQDKDEFQEYLKKTYGIKTMKWIRAGKYFEDFGK